MPKRWSRQKGTVPKQELFRLLASSLQTSPVPSMPDHHACCRSVALQASQDEERRPKVGAKPHTLWCRHIWTHKPFIGGFGFSRIAGMAIASKSGITSLILVDLTVWCPLFQIKPTRLSSLQPWCGPRPPEGNV